MAFGIDSLIELTSAAVLIWRLTVEPRRGRSFAEAAERIATRISGALLFALAAYLASTAVWSLWTGQGQEFSLPGLLVTFAAIPIMWALSRRKLRIAAALGSRALSATPLSAELQPDPALVCGCVAGTAPAERVKHWLTMAGFVDVRVTPKPESRELIKTWAPGRNLEDHIVSAMVEARKP